MPILLSPADAAQVAGRSPMSEMHALDPVPLKDGNFALPDSVLNDPFHADVSEFLKSLDTISEKEFEEKSYVHGRTATETDRQEWLSVAAELPVWPYQREGQP